MVNKKRFLKLLLLVSALSLALLVRNSDLVRVQAIGGDDATVYLPIAIKPEPTATPTLTPTATPTVPAPSGPSEADFDLVLRVASSGADSSNCGAENNPCSTIQQAVNLAQGSTVNKILVKVAQGTYTGDADAVVNIGSVFVGQSRNLTLVGGYSTSNWSEPSATASQTVVHGQDTRRGFHIISVDDINVSIQNMTIQNGRVSGIENVFGGGIFCKNDNPNEPKLINLSLSNLIVKNNVAQGGDVNNNVAGGGVAVFFRCPAVLQDITFEGNQVLGADSDPRGTQALGGGLFATQLSHVTAKNLTFTNNKAMAGSGGVGFTDGNIFNRADGLGGAAAFSINTVISLENVTATGNQAVAGQGSQYGGFANGGAFFFEKSEGTITNGTVQNSAVIGGNSPAGEGGVGGGGAIMTTESTLNLNRLTVLNNSATGGDGGTASSAGGGAFYFGTSTVNGTNLILAHNIAAAGTGNRSGGGGALFNIDSNVTFIHTTMARNTVQSELFGSAIVTLNTLGSSKVDITHSIIGEHDDRDIFDNPKGALCSIQGGGNVINLNTTLFSNNAKDYDTLFNCSGTINDVNPLSGEANFVSAGAPNFNYHIADGSDAIDKATGSTTPDDIDGDSRPNGSAADIGADER